MKTKFLYRIASVRTSGLRSVNVWIHKRPRWSEAGAKRARRELVTSILLKGCPVDAAFSSVQHCYVGLRKDEKKHVYHLGWDRYLEFAFDRRADAERFLGWCKLILKGRWAKA